MTEDKKISNSEESLEIITRMINKAKVNIRAGSFYFLLWRSEEHTSELQSH